MVYYTCFRSDLKEGQQCKCNLTAKLLGIVIVTCDRLDSLNLFILFLQHVHERQPYKHQIPFAQGTYERIRGTIKLIKILMKVTLQIFKYILRTLCKSAFAFC